VKTFRRYDPNQTLLLSPNLDDWLEEGHLARFVSDTVGALDVSGILDSYDEARGGPPYDPVMMVKLLVYGNCVGVRSSRKIAQACSDQVSFRWLAAGNQPRHTAVADFRLLHVGRFEVVFKEVLRLAGKSGLVRLATVSIDGTKMKANAALVKNRKWDDLQKEEKRLDDLVKEISRAGIAEDEADDREYGKDGTPYELPEHLRSKAGRAEAIRKAKESLAKEREEAKRDYDDLVAKRKEQEEALGRKLGGRKPKLWINDDARRNLTDVDSRVMTGRQGFIQGYNAQAAVDADSHLIVGALVTQEANDFKQQNPVLEAIRASTGRYPKRVLEDAGFWSETEILRAPDGVELFVATSTSWKQRKALRDQPSPRGRIPANASLKERMERKLRTKRGQARYMLRSQTVEAAFGRIKEDQGVRAFLLRGLRKVAGEWNLVTTSHNVKRMWRLANPT
jgi:transposase